MKIRAAAVRRGSVRPDFVAVLQTDGRTTSGGPSGPLGKALAAARKTGDLLTGFREIGRFHPTGAGTPKRLVTIGMGKKSDVTTDRLRRAAALVRQTAEKSKVRKVILHVPEAAIGGVSGAAAARASGGRVGARGLPL